MTFSWTIEFTDSTLNVVVPKGGDRTLAPGAYGAVRVQPGATLRLAGGTYNFGALRIEPKARVVADTTAGPLFLYVDAALDVKEAIEAGGQEANIFVGYLGTGDATFSAPFAGTIVAPHATLKLDPSPKGYRGSFFAETIEVGPRAIVQLDPFAAWDFIFPPTPVLGCVARFDGSHSNALWGYENPLEVAVTIPVGTRNRFTPPEGQPITTFEPGLHENVFWAAYSSSSLAWSLGGKSVTADATSRRCGFADLPPTPSGPAAPNGEGSSPPRPSLLPLIGPPILSGVTFQALAPPVRPPPFPAQDFKFVIDDQTFGSVRTRSAVPVGCLPKTSSSTASRSREERSRAARTPTRAPSPR